MRTESPTVNDENILSMAACLMGKYDRIGWAGAYALLINPNANLLREKWFPVAQTALEHFNFIPRPKE